MLVFGGVDSVDPQKIELSKGRQDCFLKNPTCRHFEKVFDFVCTRVSVGIDSP